MYCASPTQAFLTTGTLIACLLLTASACQTLDSESPKPKTIPSSQWARLDADDQLQHESEKTFYSGHRVFALNDHDLHDRHNARVKDRTIDCLLRKCRLYPGQHSIDISYFWNSFESEKKKRRRQTWQGFGFFLGMLAGVAGDAPDGSRNYPCGASVTFDVRPSHDYVLNIIHTSLDENPSEFQIVEIDTGLVVGKASPDCFGGLAAVDVYALPKSLPAEDNVPR